MLMPRIIDEVNMTESMDARIRAGLCTCFPRDTAVFSQQRAWHSTPTYSVVVEHDEQVVAHAGVVSRQITVGAQRLLVAGVQNVFVLPEHRGRYLVDQVMAAAMNEAKVRGHDCGLLFCLPALEKVYRRCGWDTVSCREVVRIEQGIEKPLPESNIVMFHPLQVAQFPPGPIHLCGNDW